jgi:hypothetical protein
LPGLLGPFPYPPIMGHMEWPYLKTLLHTIGMSSWGVSLSHPLLRFIKLVWLIVEEYGLWDLAQCACEST